MDTQCLVGRTGRSDFGRGLRLHLQPVFFDPSIKRGAGDSQDPCRLELVAVRVKENVADMVSLDVLERAQADGGESQPRVLDRFGKVAGPDDLPGGEDRGPLDDMLQLPDVSWPVIAAKELLRTRRERARRTPQLVVIATKEVLREKRDVLRPLPQGGKPQGHPVQPVIKVGAKRPFLD